MDEAVSEAFRGVRHEVAAVRGDVLSLRRDFDVHVKDDAILREQIAKWTGALQLSAWVLGLGIPAILAALCVHVARHWTP
jgi:hypothetical protein